MYRISVKIEVTKKEGIEERVLSYDCQLVVDAGRLDSLDTMANGTALEKMVRNALWEASKNENIEPETPE